jgi:hypothetical protein
MRRYPPVQYVQPGEIPSVAHNPLIEPAQSYFRETDLPSLLCKLLFFNPNIQPDQAVPQEFALQFWNEDKTTNVGLILEAISLLLGSKGAGVGHNTRLLIEMALASNAPTTLKVKVPFELTCNTLRRLLIFL